ncbi:PHP domain-containing protein [Crassaminicella thermophila]|uniref:PHP domain-containing protein n=1 Tax=Crassaminicella thermophila TaxID=2599308 RepID=A0A5C0SCC5_CRATE|nr:PHP domain-containing protein [Crassaminicella thermophila]QEK11582.1 PHP domain-containing protein [Crassaminicella thermophila]
MKIFADYHTHTLYSHGKGTIQQNVEAAIKKGLTEIAISDHGFGHFLYGIKKNDLPKMREEIAKINKSTDKIKVKLGIEANIISIDGKLDVDKETLKSLDIVLAGYHFGAIPKNIIDCFRIHGNNFLARYFPTVDRKVRVINTDAVVAAIYNNPIDILTHPGAKANIDTKEVAKAAAKMGTALEINSSHGHLTVEYIKIAMKEGAKFVISSDAHRPEDVGNVDKGIQRAIQAELSIDQIINAKE